MHFIPDEQTLILSSGVCTRHNNGLWDSVNARFSPRAISLLCGLPALTGVLIFLATFVHYFAKLDFSRPLWLRDVIERSPDPLKGFYKNQSSSYWPSPSVYLILTSIAGLICEIVKLIIHPAERGRLTVHEPILLALAWLLSLLVVSIQRPRTAPCLLLIHQVCVCLVECIIWVNGQYVPTAGLAPNTAAAIVAFIAILVILNMPMTDPRLSKENISSAYSPPTNELRSPEDDIKLWQFLSVSWMSPLISTGLKRQLNEADVWKLSYQFLHRALHDAFSAVPGTMIVRVVKANAIDIFITMALGLVELFASLAVPVVLQQLLRRMQDPDSPPAAAIKFAALILAAELIGAQAGQLNTWYCRRAYERSRGEMITTMYEKTMTRKMAIVGENEILDDQQELEKRRSASKGKIFNLMRGDVYNVAQRFWEIPPLLQVPLGLVLSIVLVWKIIGWPCLLGTLAVIIGQGINALLIRYILKLERRRRAITDTKLERTASLVEAIRHLRWYGWQGSWLEDILEARQRELHLKVSTGLCKVAVSSINTLSNVMFPVIAFFAYTKLAELPLTVDIAFPAFSLFNMLDSYLRQVPGLITVMLDAYIAVERLQQFMEEEDKVEERAPADTQLQLRNASFAWPGTQRAVLKDLSLTFPPGLTVVTGKVGSGKTAMLQALLGELDLREGELIRPDGGIAYCSQIPWLESKSIRDNIIFAVPYDAQRYRQVIDACALVQDFAGFKNADLTNIGENGVGLSGGQRARIALARAVYSQNKIVLLDDPLSALDLTTSKQIIEKCFGGSLLSGRAVLVVTNHAELFEDLVTQSVIIEYGRTTALEHSRSRSGSEDSVATAVVDITNAPVKDLDMDEAVPEKFMEDEHRSHGGVQASVYWQYVKAGRLRWWGILSIVLLLFRFFAVLRYWFLKEWGEAYGTEQEGGGTLLGFLQRLPSPEENVTPWLLWFFGINALAALTFFIAQCFMLVVIYAAGKRMFREVMIKVCNATFRFYDVTPVGRLMNRLTGDINTVDGNISQQFQQVLELSITWISSIVVIASVTPIFLVISLMLTAAFVYVFLRFLPTSQSLRRLEMVSLSPLMTDFGALMDGLLTIRAFGVQQRFLDRLITVVDNFQGMDHFYWSLQAWLQYRFDILSASSTFLLTLIAVYTKLSPGLTAFVLVSANKLVSATHRLCKQYGQLHMDFVSVERIVELLHLEQEDPGHIMPPAAWPSSAKDIEFHDLTLRYAPHLPPALTNITLRIPSGKNTALIGRTGCGKTTLALSLLSTLPLESGTITIDDLDITNINKQALRSRITFLAQEPVLFPGTVRENLDPIQEHTDEDCAAVLDRTCAGYGFSLTTRVESGGKNLSQGQRQLIALARALLRRSAIVIMDEATASVDAETAARVQDMVREELRGSTVITIAHRVEAVRGADWCVLLSKGQVVDQGEPERVLREQGSRVE